MQIGLFKRNANNKLEPYAVIPKVVMGKKTDITDLLGLDCPELVYPNHQGWGYTNVRLDSISMKTVLDDNAIGRVDDPLLRSMLLTRMFSAVGDKLITNERVFSELISKLASEQNDRVIGQILADLIQNLEILERKGEPQKALLAEYSKQAEDVLWRQISPGIEAGKVSDNFKLGPQAASTFNLRLSSYTRIARSEVALYTLLSLLEQSATIPRSLVGQNIRWRIILRLAERGHQKAGELIAIEGKADGSDGGYLSAIAAEAALADAQIKAQWVERILGQENLLPLLNQRAAMNSLFPSGQEVFQRTLLSTLAAAVPAQAMSRDNYFLKAHG